jgi:hypothetical protein
MLARDPDRIAARRAGLTAVDRAIAPAEAVREVARPHGRAQRVAAYLAAISLASAAAYFSIGGLVELFPAQAIPVAVLGALLEVAKLVMCAWLTAHGGQASGLLRAVMIGLVVGLITINAGGTFARLIEAHYSLSDEASTAVGEKAGALDAKIAEQERRVAGVEKQDSEIADVISTMTTKGQTKTALQALGQQQARRDAIGNARQAEADKLVDLKAQRSHLEAEGRRVFAATGSARFLAAQLGTDAETVIRWLVLILVLLTDPTAIALTIAATMRT